MQTSYFVCATPRSGSSLLCEVLTSSGLAGDPQEYFWSLFEPEWAERWETLSYSGYLEAALCETSTANGVFGAKVMWEHVGYLADRVPRLMGRGDEPLPHLLDSIFPDLHYVFLYRRDTVRQAVSLARALQTWIWNDTGGGMTPRQVPVFDFSAIERLTREIDEHNNAWRMYFEENGIEPFTVVYEDFVEERDQTACRILEFLGIDLPEAPVFPEPRLRRQSDTLSDEWVRRYREEAVTREAAGEPV